MGAGAGAVAGCALYGWDPGQDLDRGDERPRGLRYLLAFGEGILGGRESLRYGRRLREPQPAFLGTAHLALRATGAAGRLPLLRTDHVEHHRRISGLGGRRVAGPPRVGGHRGGDVDRLIALARDTGARPDLPDTRLWPGCGVDGRPA